jgi:hypothetical protein
MNAFNRLTRVVQLERMMVKTDGNSHVLSMMWEFHAE